MSDGPYADRPYADPAHPGNKVRLHLRCLGCGCRGVTTAWGRWCLPCNTQRMDRIRASLSRVAQVYGLDPD